MPSVTQLARDVAAKVWPVVTARSQQGWQWLMARGDPITWAALRARLITPPIPRTNGGRLVTVGGIGVLFLAALLWYASGQKDEKGAVTYPHASLVNPILGGLGALFLIYAAIRQARTATEVAQTGNRQAEIAGRRHVTDTFSKAVEQLGSDQREVRVGGIYTLERLGNEALDSERDGDLYWTVMETLTAFVRERARWQEQNRAAKMTPASDLWRSGAQPDERQLQPEPVTDIAAVMAVIRRRPEAGRARERRGGWRFDLRAADLRGAHLVHAHLEGAILRSACLDGADLTEAHLERAAVIDAHLESAILAEAHLEHALLLRTHLERAVLLRAHLERAVLIQAHLERAVLIDAHLEGAILFGANLEGTYLREAHLEGADLSGADGLTQEQVDEAVGDAATLLPEGLTRPAHWTQPERGAEPAA